MKEGADMESKNERMLEDLIMKILDFAYAVKIDESKQVADTMSEMIRLYGERCLDLLANPAS